MTGYDGISERTNLGYQYTTVINSLMKFVSLKIASSEVGDNVMLLNN